MNTVNTSVIGSIGLALAGVLVGWLASHNIIPAADVGADTAVIATVLVGAIGGAIVWFKAHMSTLNSNIAAVNASGTVKTVPVEATAPMVTAAPTPTDAKIAAVNAIDGVKVVRENVPAPQVSTVPNQP